MDKQDGPLGWEEMAQDKLQDEKLERVIKLNTIVKELSEIHEEANEIQQRTGVMWNKLRRILYLIGRFN